MQYRVHIVIADKGWILEKCAQEIARVANNVRYGLQSDPRAEIQYYLNYSARRRRVSPLELAFFTHREPDDNASRRYFESIRAVDHCVFMSHRYADEISNLEESRKSVIVPGVDLQEFVPKVRIGVVGRTYHTGRKGETLVSEVLDVEGIEWRFTGSGWPLPSRRIPDDGMPDFYNDLDYVLVPAFYEGGPMAVLEGLACGVPIISSDVGWVNEYPHLAFENGNAASLRAILEGLVAERNQLRNAVVGRSWDAWGQQHVELFDRLASEKGLASSSGRKSALKAATPGGGSSLLTHGGESAILGGPTVRVPRTAEALANQGWSASLASEEPTNCDDHAISHIFNIWPVASCLQASRRARSVGKITVLSTIFLNLSDHMRTQDAVRRMFSEGQSHASIDLQLRALWRELSAAPNEPTIEPIEGYHASVRQCVGDVDAVVYLSEYERRCLEAIGAKPRRAALVRNPIDVERFVGVDPDLFRKRFGLDEYILCVGRIEHRKNQLILAHAARSIGKKVVFIGHDGDPEYANLVRLTAGEFGLFVPRIEPDDPLLASAFAGASVFCLPSWAEGAPLAALEAAAAGAPLVLSDRSSEPEYFGDLADYVHPADIDGMRGALLHALEREDRQERAEAVRAHLREHNSWACYARETIALYEELLAARETKLQVEPARESRFLLDLTSSFHGSGHPTGIARVERKVLEALIEEHGDRLMPVVWNSRTESYLKLDTVTALMGASLEELTLREANGEIERLIDLPSEEGLHLVIVGGAWIRNPKFIRAVRQVKKRLGCSLTLLVHDLIQMKLRHLYPEGVGDEFERNARLMCDAADNFLIYSDRSGTDLHQFLLAHGQFYKRIDKFRLGDLTSFHVSEEAAKSHESDLTRAYTSKPFAIFVSSIEIRKNHILLINVWRRLIQERGARVPNLLFIGRKLWRGDEVAAALDREPELRRFVHILDDVSDADLDWFYRNCQFTLFPSLYEGWGLPVAESLSFGKMCIAASDTSIDEIAPGLVELIDPYDFKAWHDRIAFYIDHPDAVERREAKIRAGYEPASWMRAGEAIAASAKSIAPSEHFQPSMRPGTSLKFSLGQSEDPLDYLDAEGWSHPERRGRWSIGETTVLSFRFSSHHGGLRLKLNAFSFAGRGSNARTFQIRVEDLEPIEVDIPVRPCTLDIQVKGRPLDTKDLVRESTIEIRPKEILSPKMLGMGADERQLGIFVQSVDFLEPDPKFFEKPVQVIFDEVVVRAEHDQRPDESQVDIVNPLLVQARALVTLPKRFTGKGRMARLMRASGMDVFYLRRQARLHRREFQSISLIIEYLTKS